jgi:hypothetical protein
LAGGGPRVLSKKYYFKIFQHLIKSTFALSQMALRLGNVISGTSQLIDIVKTALLACNLAAAFNLKMIQD